MVALPSGITYGQVQWTVISIDAVQTNDPTAFPEANGVNGTVTITASPSAPLLVQGGPQPHLTVFPGPWTFPVINGVLQDAEGNTAIYLPATDCAIWNPTNFTYSVAFTLDGGKKRGSFSFSLPTGAVVDFTDYTPVPDSGGTFTIRGAQGDPGPAGPQGPAGAGSDDTSISALVNNTSTATYAAVGVASKAVIEAAASVNPQGAWDFVQTPTVGGVLLGTGGSGASVSDATTTAKGIVQLAGDLGGTAAAPTVPGLAGKAATVHTHTSAQITDATTVGKQVLTAVDGPTARAAIGAGTSNLVIGTIAGSAKDGAYTPPDATNVVKGLVTLTGDLGGTATSPTVPGLANKAALVHTHVVSGISATGTLNSTTFLRGDGVWAVPPGSGGAPTVETIPSGSLIYVLKSGSTWPARPTARTDVLVVWKGADPSPTIVASGTGGMLNNVDTRWVTP